MAYACILVHLDTREGLVESLKLQWQGIIRLQKLDYEGVPFRCRRCHEVGNLYKDFPLLAKDKSVVNSMEEKEGNGAGSNDMNQMPQKSSVCFPRGHGMEKGKQVSTTCPPSPRVTRA